MEGEQVPWLQPPIGAILPGIRAQHKELGIIDRDTHEKDREVIDGE